MGGEVSAQLKCARTRLPIPGTYSQRTVQVEDRVREQEPPDYRTQLHIVGAGVYCSTMCAALHLLETLEIDGDVNAGCQMAVAAHMDGPTPCVRATQAKARDEEPF